MEPGRLILHTGPMFSGKTTALLTDAERYDTVTGILPTTDDRYESDAITSHAGHRLDATAIDPDAPHVIRETVDGDTEAVVIDEAQFFSAALVDTLEALVADGHTVLVAGLDRDFRAEPFHPVPAIIAIADTVHSHTATCATCGDPAPRTQRILNGEPAPADAPTVDVAGGEKYEPRCVEHHIVPG